MEDRKLVTRTVPGVALQLAGAAAAVYGVFLVWGLPPALILAGVVAVVFGVLHEAELT